MTTIKNLASRALAYVKDLYSREPARVNAAVLSVLVAVGAPLVVSGVPVAAVVSAVLAILLSGEATRSKVKPV